MSLLGGILLLARGRAQGFAAFPATRQAFLSSLAPLLAFPLVGSVLMMLRGGGLAGVTGFLETVALLLTPPVLSWEFARLWRREAAWLRFATAFGWCQWAEAAMLMLSFAAMVLLGLPSRAAGTLVVMVLACYGLWLHWFLVRRGLDLSRGRAAVVVLAMNAATLVIVLGVPGLARVAEGR